MALSIVGKSLHVSRQRQVAKTMINIRQTAPLIMMVLAVNVMSLLDTVNTALLVDHCDYIELNPLTSAMSEHSYLLFIVEKLGITLVGTLICWHFYESRASARKGLKFVSRSYCLLMIWQALLLVGVIQ